MPGVQKGGKQLCEKKSGNDRSRGAGFGIRVGSLRPSKKEKSRGATTKLKRGNIFKEESAKSVVGKESR